VVTETFTVASADGTLMLEAEDGIRKVTVTGVQTSTLAIAITESNVAQAVNGTLTVTDVDSAQTFVAQAATAGTYGTFAINAAGAWSYTMSSAQDQLTAGQVVSETFTDAKSERTNNRATQTA